LLIYIGAYLTKPIAFSMQTLIYNAHIYTVNARFEVAQAMCFQNDSLVAIGSNDDLMRRYALSADSLIDMGGKAIYPGFIDAHCHFIRYALSLHEVDLRTCQSADEMVARVVAYRQANPQVTYIIGRGWNDTTWHESVRGTLPNNAQLNKAIPDIPVVLTRIDLHAALVNEVVLQLLHYDTHTTIKGGALHQQNGKLSGLLLENAIYPIWEKLPQPSTQLLENAILEAQQNCFAVGLTTLSDALSYCADVRLFEAMQQKGQLKLRLYAMIDGASAADKAHFLQQGIQRNAHLHVRCIKYFADGALGSRGAWLLEPYSDAPNEQGIALYESEAFSQALRECYAAGFQVATHAIGDAANRFVLQHYGQILQGNNPYRWRLEHAQILQPNDTTLLKQHQIIPSIQATHATSDMNWVAQRLGDRVTYAYRWQDIWQTMGMVAAGSDFPVEDINPLLGFYAAVARRDVQGNPPDGFMPEQALTRVQALQAMTIYAAYANAEEDCKGSLEVGKYADFVVLDRDIMTVPLLDIAPTQVLQTWIGGEKVWDKTV
jgi:predicted amidohydrolase YtcJ